MYKKKTITFKEGKEKELLKEIVKYYVDNHCFDYRNLEKMVTLGFIKEKVGI